MTPGAGGHGARPRLERTAYGVLAGAVMLGVAGLVLAYPAFVLVGLAGVLVVAWSFLVVLLPVRLEVRRVVRPARVPRLEPAAGVATASNVGRRRSTAVEAKDTVDDVEVPFDLPELHPGRQATRSFAIPTRRRGLVPVGPLILTRRDGFGLARRTLRVGDMSEVLVLPRALDLPEVTASLRHSMEGVNDSRSEGALDFHILRDYVPGDDPRRIHWKSSARTGQLQVRQNVDPTRPSVVVICDGIQLRDVAVDETEQAGRAAGGDLNPIRDGAARGAGRCSSRGADRTAGGSPDEGNEAVEVAVDCAASVVVSANKSGSPVWLDVLGGDRVALRDGSGAAMVSQLLDALAMTRFPSTSASGRASLLSSAIRQACAQGPGSLAVVCTAARPESLPPTVASLAAHFTMAVVVHPGTGAPSQAPDSGLWFMPIERVEQLARQLRLTRMAA
ncbi:DUF58 domain-containing protein [uncultured Jatrophihabitans sp.]|uniref:DUF58 domain-containing protein n=1 Tax=uncultured Jatrophihabitans sp. TaxID=1610747 RepID=UPI0035CBD29A